VARAFYLRFHRSLLFRISGKISVEVIVFPAGWRMNSVKQY